jgi:hypothetical protein
MKILAVLALLISLSSAYVDFTQPATANVTQAYGSYYKDSKGSCDVSISWAQATMTLSGSITCSGLTANVTGMHFHDVTKSYTITYNTGNLISDVTVVVPADPNVWPYTFTAKLATMATIDAICNDQVYLNVHTSYEPNGEVRANFVGMRAVCNVDKGVPAGSVTAYGPTDGLKGVAIPDFCTGAIFGTATIGTGNCYFQVCWEQATAILTISGNCYGLTSDVYGIYVYYPDDSSSYFMYVSGYTFPQGCPFSFHYTGVTEWQLAKMISKDAYFTVETYDNTNGEVNVLVTTTDDSTFPTWKSVCYPRTGSLPDKPLTCYYGYDANQYSYDCTSADQLCAIYASAGDEVKTCSTWSYCYSCDCGADITTDLPSFGYACCDTSYCNIVSLSVLFCLQSGSSLIPGGLLVTLFVALLTKWFN